MPFHIDPWMFWIIIGIICMIIEIFTPGFLFMSFGLGAILTGLIALIPFIDVPVQILFFALITFILFINIRKLNKKYLTKTSIPTNMFALVGKTGTVTGKISNGSKGYVKIESEEWSAICEGKDIAKGEKVKIIAVEGNKVIVTADLNFSPDKGKREE